MKPWTIVWWSMMFAPLAVLFLVLYAVMAVTLKVETFSIMTGIALVVVAQLKPKS